MEDTRRSKEEIEKAIEDINSNLELSYSYRDDVKAILNWVLGGESFDGINEKY